MTSLPAKLAQMAVVLLGPRPLPGCQHKKLSLCRHIERDFVAWQCDDCGAVRDDTFTSDQLFAFLPPMDVYAAAEAERLATVKAWQWMTGTGGTLSAMTGMVKCGKLAR